jgi:hypothetical protein
MGNSLLDDFETNADALGETMVFTAFRTILSDIRSGYARLKLKLGDTQIQSSSDL